MSPTTPPPSAAAPELEAGPSPKALWAIALLAIVAAAAPHFFFPPPLRLHMQSVMQGYFGIAVWAPAILASVAFFVGTDLGTRLPSSHDPTLRTVALVLAPIAYAVALAAVLERYWSDMETMRPWGELLTALPMFAALHGLLAIFWQGLVQRRLLIDWPRPARWLTVVALELCIWAPFLVQAPQDFLGRLLPAMGLQAAIAAGLYEAGAPTWAAVLVRAIMGLAFVWFQQVMFL